MTLTVHQMPVYQFCSVEFIDTSSVFDTVGWMIGSAPSLFKTVNNEIIRERCSYFKFPLPSELLDKRRDKFQSNEVISMLFVFLLPLMLVNKDYQKSRTSIPEASLAEAAAYAGYGGRGRSPCSKSAPKRLCKNEFVIIRNHKWQ